MRSFRFFTMFAMLAMAIIAKLHFMPPAEAALVDVATDEVSFVMDEAITYAVIVTAPEATSTAEIVMSTLDLMRIYELDSYTTVPLLAAGSNPEYNDNILASGLLNTLSNDGYRTDNMLRGGAAFVGGGLPYRV